MGVFGRVFGIVGDLVFFFSGIVTCRNETGKVFDSVGHLGCLDTMTMNDDSDEAFGSVFCFSCGVAHLDFGIRRLAFWGIWEEELPFVFYFGLACSGCCSRLGIKCWGRSMEH